MPSPNESNGMTYRIAPDVIRVATGRVCGNQIFQLAKQQEKLLRFLVDEDLAGRAKQGSRAAVIAKFYADRSDEEAAQKLTWALARLSEKLTEYYDSDGADDPIRIFVDQRSCGLRFEMWEARSTPRGEAGPKTSMRMLVLIGALVASAIGWVVMELTPTGVVEGPQEDWPKDVSDLVTGDVVLPMDVEGLTAEELVEAARSHMYPSLDFERHKVAIALSKTAIDRDPEFARGYATAAMSMGIMSDLTQGGGLSRRYLQEATVLFDKASALDPDDGWVMATAAQIAWASDDFALANERIQAAYDADPDDGFVAHTYGVMAHFSGRFDDVLAVSAPEKMDASDPIRLVRERLYAFASYHLGDYDTTITVVESTVQAGLEHNFASLLYMASAYQAAGQQSLAEDMVLRIEEGWPTLRTDMLAEMFFIDPAVWEKQKVHLRAAGMRFAN